MSQSCADLVCRLIGSLVCPVVLLAAIGTAGAAGYTWTGGGGADTAWSNKANWGGAVAPADGESDVELVFPALTGPYTATNDLDGLELGGLAITTMLGQGNYTFAGNAVALTGGATMDSPASGNPNLLWQIPLTVGADVTVATSGRQTRLLGPIALGGHTLTLDTVGDLVLAGAISGSGALIKNNGSALTITGTNTYGGPTTNNGGALYISGPAALGDAAAGTTINGGFLGFSPGSTFTLDEPLVFSGGSLLAYGTPTVGGAMTLDAAFDVRAFDPATVITIAGSISGTGGLSKSGPGLLVMSTASARYGGATRVDAGTLQLEATLVSAQPLTVKSGATLKGNGSCAGPIQVDDGGTVAPGASPGGLSSGGLQMTAGAVYAVEIDGPDAVAQYDTLAVDGAVALNGATLAVALGYVPDIGERFTLIESSAAAVGGIFAALPEGAALQVGATTFTVTYQGGDAELIAGILPTPTATPTAAETAPGTTPTSTPTSTSIPTTAIPGACLGDCDGDGVVGVHEIILGVSIALGTAEVSVCPPFDADGDGQVTVAALIAAVGNALDGCP